MNGIRFEVRDAVAVVTIDRPERRNALSIATCHRLREVWVAIESDPRVRVAVITGSGDKAFCAGYDIAEKQLGNAVDLEDFVPRLGTVCYVTKPVIAAVNGAAVAAGLALVEACDMVIASPTAWFALPEVKLGIGVAPFVQSLWTLPQHVLMEMLLTGSPLTAQRGYEIGFVNRIAAPGNLLEDALAVADQIAANAPLIVDAAKLMIYRGLESMGVVAALETSHAIFRPLRDSDDAKEGFRARAEGRAPTWRGR